MDIFIYMLIAIWLVFRLWGVLGKRPDSSSSSGSNVIRLRREDVSVEKSSPFEQAFYEGFDESHFLQGAQKAFTQTLNALFSQDFEKLSKLVSPKLFSTLKKESPPDPAPKVKVLSLHIQERGFEGNIAKIRVHFLFSKTQGRQSEEVEENWVFERALAAHNPNWVVTEMNA